MTMASALNCHYEAIVIWKQVAWKTRVFVSIIIAATVCIMLQMMMMTRLSQQETISVNYCTDYNKVCSYLHVMLLYKTYYTEMEQLRDEKRDLQEHLATKSKILRAMQMESDSIKAKLQEQNTTIQTQFQEITQLKQDDEMSKDALKGMEYMYLKTKQNLIIVSHILSLSLLLTIMVSNENMRQHFQLKLLILIASGKHLIP